MYENKKVIVCDMDGTLSPSRQPASKEMIKQIIRLSKTHKFCIITGGKLDLIKEQITSQVISEDLEKLHLFPTSGNQYYSYTHRADDDVDYIKHYKHDLAVDDINEIIKVILDTINFFHLEPEVFDQIEYRESQITFSILGRTADNKTKAEYDPDGEKRKKYVEHIKRVLGLNADKYAIRIGGTTSIDFTYKGHDKGFGLEQIKKIFKCTNEDILFFGDKCFEGGNDWEIAKHVDHIQVADENECLEQFKKLIP